jgi:hypothetical protein
LAIFTHVVIHHRFCAALKSQVTWLLTLHARGDDQWAFQHSQPREAWQQLSNGSSKNQELYCAM